MGAAAAWTGYPAAVISRAKAEGCSAFVRHTVDIQKLVQWVAKAQRSATDLPDGFASWGDVLNQVKSDREKIRLAKERSEVVDFSDVARDAAEATSHYFGELERMEREMPAQLAGLDPSVIRDRISAFLKDLRSTARIKFSQPLEVKNEE